MVKKKAKKKREPSSITSTGDTPGKEEEEEEKVLPFQMKLTDRFVLLSFGILCLLSYGLGKVCRIFVLGGLMQKFYPDLYGSPPLRKEEHSVGVITELPQPLLLSGKRIPRTIYTSKQFSTALPATSDSILLARRPKLQGDDEGSNSFTLTADGEAVPTQNESGAGEDMEIHYPKGQHLIVDIENVDGNFLNSEESLAEAMLELVNESGLTLLSYHCHSLDPMGVSCVGILLESHVSFHTWPVPGVITFDIFTCGEQPLAPLLTEVERLFGVPKETTDGEGVEAPRTIWSFKERGFDRGNNTANPEAVEMNHYLRGWMEFDLKNEVVSVETEFQTVDIFDVVNPKYRTFDSYKKSLAKDGSYESNHPEIFQPDRVVYLDQVMQSRRYGDAAYHESLVHPAMFAHDEPRRVAIIGGGEGATLREVLKHNTLEKVVMIEIDEIMANVSRQYLPEWSDCSNIAGSKSSCFDDPRAEVYYEDAIAWFIDRYSEGVEFDPSDRFDVIVMDALDPSSATEFSDILYNNNKLMSAISNALTDEGVLISQVGQSEYPGDPPIEYTRESTLETSFIPQLSKHGFEKIKNYEDMHGGFGATWSYLIAFKDATNLENWYSNQASIDLEIRYRVQPTVSGESPLRYFDGATMRSFAYPSSVSDRTFCLKTEKPPFCDRGHGIDPEWPNAPITSFEVKESSILGAGRGLFAKKFIPKGSYLALEVGVHSMSLLPGTARIIQDMTKKPDFTRSWNIFGSYYFGYGYASDFYGHASYSVDAGILTFMNHGCDGTYNIGTQTSVTEATASPNEWPPELEYTFEAEVYNPYVDRNAILMMSTVGDRFLKDIKPGDEILDNFLSYLHGDNWEWGVHNYRSMCKNEAGAGVVSAYENDEDPSVVY